MDSMNLIHVASGGGMECVFWGVVIAVFVVSQIAKSRKKFDESAPQQQNPADGGGDPAEELRKFLEGLGQAPSQPPAPPPAPVAPPPPPRPSTQAPAQPRRVTAQRVKARTVVPPPMAHEEPPRRRIPEPVPEAAMPDEAAVLARYKAELAAAAVAAPAKATTKWRAILTAELLSADRQPVRKAFVLRELLGPPTALRRSEIVYPLV